LTLRFHLLFYCLRTEEALKNGHKSTLSEKSTEVVIDAESKYNKDKAANEAGGEEAEEN
jgi:hypothetical protein